MMTSMEKHIHAEELGIQVLKSYGWDRIDDENGNKTFKKDDVRITIYISGNTKAVINHKIGSIDKIDTKFVMLISNICSNPDIDDSKFFILPTTHAKNIKSVNGKGTEGELVRTIHPEDYFKYKVDNNIDDLLSIDSLNSPVPTSLQDDLHKGGVNFMRKLSEDEGYTVIDCDKKGIDLVITKDGKISTIGIFTTRGKFKKPNVTYNTNNKAEHTFVVSVSSKGYIVYSIDSGNVLPSVSPIENTISKDYVPRPFHVSFFNTIHGIVNKLAIPVNRNISEIIEQKRKEERMCRESEIIVIEDKKRREIEERMCREFEIIVIEDKKRREEQEIKKIIWERGNSYRDGYNIKGYDKEGYNKEGRDEEGCDKSGYDIDGFNRPYGYHKFDDTHRKTPGGKIIRRHKWI